MKKYIIFALLTVFCLGFCACSNDTAPNDTASDEIPEPESSPVGCFTNEPNEYNTLGEFISAVKNNDEPYFCNVEKNYFYLPQNLPDEYNFSKIIVNEWRVKIEYKFDTENDEEIPLVYSWYYRGYGDGSKEANKRGLQEAADKFTKIGYSSTKSRTVYGIGDYAEKLKDTSKATTDWYCIYLQDADVLEVIIPYTIEPDALRDALEMKKVDIQ